MQENDLLKYAIENGMIDLQHLQSELNMKERKKYLEKHPYSIWQGKNDNKFYTYLPDKTKKRVLIKRNTEREVQNIVIDYWKQQELNPTLREVFDEWNDRRLELKKIAASTHSRNERDFNRYYSEIQNVHIRSVDEDFLINFLEEQVPKYELTAKAFSNLRTITRGMFKRAKKRKLIDLNIEDVFSDLDLSDREFKKVIKEDYEEVFDEAETDTMIRYLKENLDIRNLGILLMFITGIRVGELVTLKHADFYENTFQIRRTERKYTDQETKKDVYEVVDMPKTEAGIRTAVIPSDFAWVVQRLKLQNPFGDYIFYENGKRLTTNSIRQRMYRVCKKLNIYPKSPHKARKTYGTILIDNNVDTKMITSLMGHTSILCTEKHYHRNRKTLAKKTAILSNIPDFQTDHQKVINK